MTIEHFLGVCLDLHYVHFTEKGQGPAQVPKSRMDSRAGPHIMARFKPLSSFSELKLLWVLNFSRHWSF